MSGKNIRLDITLIMDAAVGEFKKRYYLLGLQFYLLAYLYILSFKGMMVWKVRFHMGLFQKECLFFL